MSFIKPALSLDESNKYRPLSLEDKAWILGVRGWNGPNQVGIYDDALFLITPNGVEGFNGNTDPSRVIKGVAQLMPGTYYYKKGIHGLHHLDLNDPHQKDLLDEAVRSGRDISNLTYWAFRQDSDVSVKREGDDTIHTDNINNRFWIDIHRGGTYTTSSAGCQTLPPDQWPDFKAKGYAAMDEFNQSRIPYVLSLKK